MLCSGWPSGLTWAQDLTRRIAGTAGLCFRSRAERRWSINSTGMLHSLSKDSYGELLECGITGLLSKYRAKRPCYSVFRPLSFLGHVWSDPRGRDLHNDISSLSPVHGKRSARVGAEMLKEQRHTCEGSNSAMCRRDNIGLEHCCKGPHTSGWNLGIFTADGDAETVTLWQILARIDAAEVLCLGSYAGMQQ
jgi:hypothetical protein